MKNRNSQEEMVKWINFVLDHEKTTLTTAEKLAAKKVAMTAVQYGALRGTVCDSWRKMGFQPHEIFDFFP